jgi:hypothetical protein
MKTFPYGATRWSDEELAYLRENYSTVPTRQIAAHLYRTDKAICARARLLGLKSRQRAGVNSLVKDYFKVIDTPMKAWILGLLTADGSVTKETGQLKLELHSKDFEILETVRDELAPEARIRFRVLGKSPMARFVIQDQGLRADLASHGVVNAKSLITTWPAGVPDRYLNSFICGYFDGDGSLGTNPALRWAVVSGNPAFLRVMQSEILRLTGLVVGGPYQDRRHQHAWSIVATGKPVRALDAWIHVDVPGLTRKNLAAVLKSDKVA